jgi:hypothetical protein
VNSGGGWFRFPRRLFEHDVWMSSSPAVWRVLTAIYAQANYEDAVWFDGRQKVHVPAGAFVTSRTKMCAFCDITPKQFRHAIQVLEGYGLVKKTERANRWTMLTLLECGSYGEESEKKGQGPTKGPTQGPTEFEKKGQLNSPVSVPIHWSCADDTAHRGQLNLKKRANRRANRRATIEEVRNKKGGGEHPALEENGGGLAIVAPPPAQAISETIPAAAVRVEQLVRELAKVHPGDAAVPFAVKDALDAFQRSGDADVNAWCERVRQAHSNWREELRWTSDRKKPKALGYWFQDGEHERAAAADVGPYAPMDKAQPMPKPMKPIKCKRCADSGLAFPDKYKTPWEKVDEPGFDLDAYLDAIKIPCMDCEAGAKQVKTA